MYNIDQLVQGHPVKCFTWELGLGQVKMCMRGPCRMCSFIYDGRWKGEGKKRKKTMRSIVILLIPPNGIICTQKENSERLWLHGLNQNILILVTEAEYV